MAKKDPEPMIHEAPVHGTVVDYAMPGVVTVTVPFGIHPESGMQVPLEDKDAVTVEPRITSLRDVSKKGVEVKKVVTPVSKGVETV